MIRFVLGLCLLAYPRAVRRRDREFLCDLALELGGTRGVTRQAVSLVLGGLNERIESRRRRGAAPMRTWARRGAVGCIAVIVLTVAASGIGGGDAGSVHEVEQYACSPSRLGDASGCADTRRLVAARKQEGWDCTSHRRSGGGRQSTSWECTRGSAAVAWPLL